MRENMEEFRNMVSRCMERWHIPGAAMAVTSGDSVLMEEVWGVRNLADKKPVTPETRFVMASCTKAFNAEMIASLADDGIIEFDTPIVKYVPEFRLWDRAATEEITMRDMLCHRSGLGGHDAMWPNTWERKDFLYRLRFLEPNKPFRYCSQYSNVIFAAAGYLAESISGKPWEKLVQERILDPLGMDQSGFSAAEMCSMEDFAVGYRWHEDKLEEMPPWEMTGAEPAAGLYSNLRDMEKWLQMQVQKGRYGGKQIISEKNILQTQSPQSAMQSYPWNFPEFPGLGAYGMGWMIRVFRGIPVIYHHGEIEGFCTFQAVVPALERGIVILANRHACCHGFQYTLLFQILDKMLGEEDAGWEERLWQHGQKLEAEEKPDTEEKAQASLTGKDPDPVYPLQEYAGNYVNPAYGTLQVVKEEKELKLYFKQWKLPVKYQCGQTFLVSNLKEDTMFMDVPLTYEFDEKTGKAKGFFIKLEPLVNEIRFEKE